MKHITIKPTQCRVQQNFYFESTYKFMNFTCNGVFVYYCIGAVK